MKHYWRKSRIITIVMLFMITVAVSEVHAMHIMEGFLPKAYALFWWVLYMPFLIMGMMKLKKGLEKGHDNKLLIGLVAAFTFCISALKIPSVAGSSSHPTGIGLGSILFGPLMMAFIAAIVLLLQALILSHGGITTLGANGFSMGVVGPFAAFIAYKLAIKSGLSKRVAIFIAAFSSNFLTYVMTSIQLGTAFSGQEGVMISTLKYLSIFSLTQLPIAILEGFLTVIIFNLLWENKEQIHLVGMEELI
ncbi:MAG: energy-coupling factor ABC transporter permease [Vallitaleaceae bacterium]|nr:energy-coupling factor ABC transporter permease [Vallitaleaceae bacterium]